MSNKVSAKNVRKKSLQAIRDDNNIKDENDIKFTPGSKLVQRVSILLRVILLMKRQVEKCLTKIYKYHFNAYMNLRIYTILFETKTFFCASCRKSSISVEKV